MIVAGIGSRKGVAAQEVLDLIARALAEANIDHGRLDAIATAEAKSHEPGILAAALELNVAFAAVPHEQLQTAEGGTSWSTHSVRLFDVGSVSESAALAAAGEGSTLLLPRIKSSNATCALAQSAGHDASGHRTAGAAA